MGSEAHARRTPGAATFRAAVGRPRARPHLIDVRRSVTRARGGRGGRLLPPCQILGSHQEHTPTMQIALAAMQITIDRTGLDRTRPVGLDLHAIHSLMVVIAVASRLDDVKIESHVGIQLIPILFFCMYMINVLNRVELYTPLHQESQNRQKSLAFFYRFYFKVSNRFELTNRLGNRTGQIQ